MRKVGRQPGFHSRKRDLEACAALIVETHHADVNFLLRSRWKAWSYLRRFEDADTRAALQRQRADQAATPQVHRAMKETFKRHRHSWASKAAQISLHYKVQIFITIRRKGSSYGFDCSPATVG
jgi:hypothetical protein